MRPVRDERGTELSAGELMELKNLIEVRLESCSKTDNDLSFWEMFLWGKLFYGWRPRYYITAERDPERVPLLDPTGGGGPADGVVGYEEDQQAAMALNEQAITQGNKQALWIKMFNSCRAQSWEGNGFTRVYPADENAYRTFIADLIDQDKEEAINALSQNREPAELVTFIDRLVTQGNMTAVAIKALYIASPPWI